LLSRGAYTARAVAAMIYKVGLLTQGNEELIEFAWDMFKRDDNKDLRGSKKTFCPPVPVHFLGLWTRFSSVGWAGRPNISSTPEQPASASCAMRCRLDERRAYFVQNSGAIKADRYRAGLGFRRHCDVGGGYPRMNPDCPRSRSMDGWARPRLTAHHRISR